MLKSKAQARLMYAIKNNKELAKEKGISQDVANEFIKSTPKKKFSKLKEKLGIK